MWSRSTRSLQPSVWALFLVWGGATFLASHKGLDVCLLWFLALVGIFGMPVSTAYIIRLSACYIKGLRGCELLSPARGKSWRRRRHAVCSSCLTYRRAWSGSGCCSQKRQAGWPLERQAPPHSSSGSRQLIFLASKLKGQTFYSGKEENTK